MIFCANVKISKCQFILSWSSSLEIGRVAAGRESGVKIYWVTWLGLLSVVCVATAGAFCHLFNKRLLLDWIASGEMGVSKRVPTINSRTRRV